MSRRLLAVAAILALAPAAATRHRPTAHHGSPATTAAASAERNRVIASIALVDLPGGTYTMGVAAGEEHEEQSYPAHAVTLAPFRMATTTVTFDQYDPFARATGRALPQDEGFGRGTRPAINLDRADRLAFIAWLNAGTGRHFRLPSESEWEYAARGGTKTTYYWGEASSGDFANLTGDSKGRDHFIATAPVATFLPNGFGLYDMVGNVWQAVDDCRHGDLAAAPTDGRPWIDLPCDSRIVRGGFYGSITRGSRVTARAAAADGFRSMALGFRLVEDAGDAELARITQRPARTSLIDGPNSRRCQAIVSE